VSRKKTIVALWHYPEKGKTETLRQLAKLLTEKYPGSPILSKCDPSFLPESGDFRQVAKIRGKKVAIESQGDPKTNLQWRLSELAETIGAELIFCCTRPSGETVDAVVSVAATFGFELVWTSTYQVDTDVHQANRLKAEHLWEMAETRSMI
jgi:hypothetical protein